MARYAATVTSAAALADDTGFAWLMGSATAGGKLRRVILGCRNTTAATAVTDFQCKVGINRVTADGVTITAVTANKLDARHPTAGMRVASGWGTVPTQGAEATDIFSIPFNAKSGVDIPAEWKNFRVRTQRSLVLVFTEIVVNPAASAGRRIKDRLRDSRWRGDARTWGEIYKDSWEAPLSAAA